MASAAVTTPIAARLKTGRTGKVRDGVVRVSMAMNVPIP